MESQKISNVVYCKEGGCRVSGKDFDATRNLLRQLLGEARHWERCEGVWCGGCLVPTAEDKFPMRIPLDDGGQPVFLDAKDEGRFVVARVGDDLSIRFQCGKCHFRNVQGRDSIPGDRYNALTSTYISRATLEEFWSREAGTVRGSRSSTKAAFRCSGLVKGDGIFPHPGPFPLKDVDGMR